MLKHHSTSLVVDISLLNLDMANSHTASDIENRRTVNSQRDHGIENGVIAAGDNDEAVGEESSRDTDLTYGVEETPPWYITLVYAMQQIMASIDTPLAMAYIISNNLCTDGDASVMGQLIGLGIFLTGVATLLTTTLGIRLPVLQLPSFTFIPVILAVQRVHLTKCQQMISFNSTLNYTANASLSDGDDPLWRMRLQELGGGVLLAAGVQSVLGLTGLFGLLMRRVGPLTIGPAVLLLGVSIADSFIPAMHESWGIALMTMGLILVFSLLLGRLQVPVPAWQTGRGCYRSTLPIFKLFPHLFSAAIAWLLCYILTITDQFPSDSSQTGFRARTDAKTYVVGASQWFLFPYPGYLGFPRLTPDVIAGMFAATICNVLETVGAFYITARVCHLPPPPAHAVNRGVAVEGLANCAAGLLCAPFGTLAASSATGVLTLTGVGSRVTRQVAAVLLIVFGVIGKVGAVLSLVPDPVIAAMTSFNVGIIMAVGVASVTSVNLRSSRNLSILGMALLLGLILPSWVRSHPETINTGNEIADHVINVLLGTSVIIGSVVGFVLDNIIPGSTAERGLSLTRYTATGSSCVYDLPPPRLSAWLRAQTCCTWVPFVPAFDHERWDRACSCGKCSKKKSRDLNLANAGTETLHQTSGIDNASVEMDSESVTVKHRHMDTECTQL